MLSLRHHQQFVNVTGGLLLVDSAYPALAQRDYDAVSRPSNPVIKPHKRSTSSTRRARPNPTPLAVPSSSSIPSSSSSQPTRESTTSTASGPEPVVSVADRVEEALEEGNNERHEAVWRCGNSLPKRAGYRSERGTSLYGIGQRLFRPPSLFSSDRRVPKGHPSKDRLC